MKHKPFADGLEELGNKIEIRNEELPTNLPVHSPDPILDHYRTFLGEPHTSNILGSNSGKFLGKPIPDYFCDSDDF